MSQDPAIKLLHFIPVLPDLYRLHERHSGFYEPLCIAYADAAILCLEKHHLPPVEFGLHNDQALTIRRLSWTPLSPSIHASWNNNDDAVRDGAYSIALAAVEADMGLVALARAETRTGADYYVGRPGSDIENAHRLEVSGT